jgi:hypothetical protein
MAENAHSQTKQAQAADLLQHSMLTFRGIARC